MKPDDQRIAIAEACGWRIESDGASTFVYAPNSTTGNGYRTNDTRHPKIIRLLPDYLNDLNAMHEAVKTLPYPKNGVFINWLNYITKKTKEFPETATAAQRAEAFLRTIGKWTEDER